MRFAGFGLSSVSWLTFLATFLSDLSRYSLERTWLWRFPLVLIAAGALSHFLCTWLGVSALWAVSCLRCLTLLAAFFSDLSSYSLERT